VLWLSGVWRRAKITRSFQWVFGRLVIMEWLSRTLMLSLIGLTLSACRFGNHSDSVVAPAQESIQSSELFFTAATNFQTYAYFSDQQNPVANQNAPLVSVPSQLLDVFTNPVYWDTLNDPGQTQFFWDVNQAANPWVTRADAAGMINAESDYPSNGGEQFYHNRACLTQVKTLQEGGFNRKVPGSFLISGHNQMSHVSGHLTLDITFIQVFSGDCADDLTELANCFANGAGCDADQLSRAKIFSLYTQTGALDIKRASKLIGLAYVVHFE
jgi:hypothetical protein